MARKIRDGYSRHTMHTVHYFLAVNSMPSILLLQQLHEPTPSTPTYHAKPSKTPNTMSCDHLPKCHHVNYLPLAIILFHSSKQLPKEMIEILTQCNAVIIAGMANIELSHYDTHHCKGINRPSKRLPHCSGRHDSDS